MPRKDYASHLRQMAWRYRWDKEHDPDRMARKKAYDDARRKARMDMLTEIKMSAGCVDCGYRVNADALQFDHVRGEKVVTVTALAGASLTRLMAEVAKCDVRCANCHAIVTAARRREGGK